MELPAITLPAMDLPFDIPVLLHPPVDHFAITLPVIVLLLELVNFVLKRRAVSVTSFLFITLMVLAIITAYFTGVTDGKEAFEILSDEGQEALKGHKTLGTYLMLTSGIVWIFKLLSMMMNKGAVRTLYIFILLLFVAVVLKQGKEGGKLVYVHGANVVKVQELDDEMFDVSEELDDLKAEMKKLKESQIPAVEPDLETEVPAAQASDANGTVLEESEKEEAKEAEAAVPAVEASPQTVAH